MKKAVWIGGLLVAGIVAAFWAILAPPSPQPFLDYVERLRAEGKPTTIAEAMGAFPSDEENGAIELRAAVAEVERIAGPESSWTVTGPWNSRVEQPWEDTASAAELSDLAELLDRLGPAFDLLRTASRKPRFAIDYPTGTEPLTITQPIIPDLQKAARLLGARAIAATSRSARLDAIECELRLGVTVRGAAVPTMLGGALTSLAATALRRGIETNDLDPKTARELLDPLLASGDCLARWAGFARSERAHYVELFQSILVARADPASAEKAAVDQATLHDWVQACGLTERMEALDVTSYPRLARAVTAEYDATASSSVQRTVAVPFPQIAFRTARTESVRRLARIGLAAAEHKATRGAWPTSLADLAWAFPDGIPVDRLTDEPFVYERTADGGVRIASTFVPKPEETLRETGLEWRLK